jgi:hypothetical protein
MAETAVVTLLDEIRLVVIAADPALTARTIPAAEGISTCQYKQTVQMFEMEN